MKTLKDHLKENTDIEVPWHVWTKFGSQAKHITLAGDQASLGAESDFASLQELRDAVEWYVSQLGGKVKWEK
jgi:hypothetical protein